MEFSGGRTSTAAQSKAVAATCIFAYLILVTHPPQGCSISSLRFPCKCNYFFLLLYNTGQDGCTQETWIFYKRFWYRKWRGCFIDRLKHSSYLPGYVKPCLLVTQMKKALNLRIQNKKSFCTLTRRPTGPSFITDFYLSDSFLMEVLGIAIARRFLSCIEKISVQAMVWCRWA